MTAAIRATVLVIALLAGATAIAALSIATWSPVKGGEAQDFWREIQPAPKTKVRRIIMVRYRVTPRGVPKGVATAARARPDARGTLVSRSSVPEPDRRSVLGGARPFAGAFVVRQSQIVPTSDDVDSFARRALIPDPPRDIHVPPDLMQRDLPLPIFTPPRERREPGDNRRRELCVAAVIVVAVLGGVASRVLHHNRGIVHV